MSFAVVPLSVMSGSECATLDPISFAPR